MNSIKILPIAALALVTFWLSAFNLTNLSISPEIILDLNKFLSFLISYVVFSGLFIANTIFVFALLGNAKTYIWIFSGIVAISYVFIVMMVTIGTASGLIILASIVISAILAITLPIGFMETYENLIKPKLEVCSRALISNFILFASLACAINFLIIYNNPNQKELLRDKIFAEIEKTIDATTDQAASMILKQMQLPSNTVSNSLIQNAMEQQVLTPARNILNTYLDLVIYVIALLLFVTIASIRPLISITSFILIAVMRWILTSSGYVKEEKRMVEATRLTL